MKALFIHFLVLGIILTPVAKAAEKKCKVIIHGKHDVIIDYPRFQQNLTKKTIQHLGIDRLEGNYFEANMEELTFTSNPIYKKKSHEYERCDLNNIRFAGERFSRWRAFLLPFTMFIGVLTDIVLGIMTLSVWNFSGLIRDYPGAFAPASRFFLDQGQINVQRPWEKKIPAGQCNTEGVRNFFAGYIYCE